MPRQHVENTKEFSSENEAKRANKHANRRIIYWPPFWNKVYRCLRLGLVDVHHSNALQQKLAG